MTDRELRDVLDDGVGVWLRVVGFGADTILGDDERTITARGTGDIFLEFDRAFFGWEEGRVDFWESSDGVDTPVLVVFDDEEDEGPELAGEIVEWELVSE